MTPYDKLLALLDDEDKVSVPLGAIGGAADGWTRYARVSRASRPKDLPGNPLVVSIYGNRVAEVFPTHAHVTTAGHYTPSTRAALILATTGNPYGQNVSMRTPGSRGGERGPWHAEVCVDGLVYLVDDWITIPFEVTA